MDIRFDGRVAVITGAGGGLGRSHALLLGSRGCKVVVNDRGGAADGSGAGTSMADQVVEEIKKAGGEAVANYDSVDSWEGAEKIVQSAVSAFGKIDILVNNAGILRDRSLAKITDEEYKRVIAVHLDGSFYCTRAAFGLMKGQKYGRIIFTTSAAGLYGNFGQINYSAAKMGIVGLMNTVKQEGQKDGVLTNTVAPIAASRLMGTVMPPAAMEKLQPGFVSVLVAYLAHESCKESGGIFTAGGGHYGRAAMVENPGFNLPSDGDVTVEQVRDNFKQIKDMTGAREFGSATESLMVNMAGILKR